jgi:lipid-A-disaccharide synthase
LSAAPAILFSAFEPSGDALAAAAITRLRQAVPGLRVVGLGGAKMEAAGAELLEHTTERGAMFLDTLAQAWSHHRRIRRLDRWLAANRIDALVPVDSPAGNWAVCKAVRRAHPEAKIVHLVAPQVWAWASWRVRRLRRLSDHVLCLLPFEEQWLGNRGVRATFVGHPAFDPEEPAPAQPRDALPAAHPRLALLPGSRSTELERNWPTMLGVFERLVRDHPGLQGAVAALDEKRESIVRDIAARNGWPKGLTLVTGRTEAVLDWCDIALVASGTVTLQVASRLKPMVIMYNMNLHSVIIASWLVRTRTFGLPNLVSEWAGLGRAVPELVPHFGKVEPVAREVDRLLRDRDAAERQRLVLGEVVARFRGRRFADAVERELAAVLPGTAAGRSGDGAPGGGEVYSGRSDAEARTPSQDRPGPADALVPGGVGGARGAPRR